MAWTVLKRWRQGLVAGLAGLGLLMAGPAPAATTPQIWFLSLPFHDYRQLFTAPQLWPNALAAVKVFSVSTFDVSMLDDTSLAQIFYFLNQRRIPLAMQADMQTPGKGGCGTGVEGYRAAGFMKALFTRMRRLGAQLSYIEMDEPLWFGHYQTTFPKANGGLCRAAVADVARNVAGVIADARSIFPAVQVGEVEPASLQYADASGRPVQFQQWMDAFRQATGRPLAFVHFEVVWGAGAFDPTDYRYWSGALANDLALVKANGVRTGVLYNGRPTDTDGRSWIDHAAYRFKTTEGTLKLQPDDAELATWFNYPDHFLPETDPTAMTNTVIRYLQWRQTGK